MKLFLVILIGLFSYQSFSQKALSDDEYEAILIYGDWTVYNFKSKSHRRPIIKFDKDSKCLYKNQKTDDVIGDWKVKRGRLIIDKEDEEHCVLKSGSYRISYKPYLLKNEVKVLEINLFSPSGKKISLKSKI